MANWLSRKGIQSYRIRASGHYYPLQIKVIVKAAKPKGFTSTPERPEPFS